MDSNCKKCLIRDDQDVSLDEIQQMTQYIPYKLLKYIGEKDCCIYDDKVEKIEGTIVYFDIIGFTPIVVEYLNNKKDIAYLSSSFSEFFSVIIETVRELGGSVFQFAGDSLLISFELLENESKETNFNRAFGAMLRILDLSDNYNRVSKESNGFILRPKVGIGCGDYYQVLLGNNELFVTPILIGSAVQDAVFCEMNCSKQEIVVNEQAYKYACICKLDENFSFENNVYHLIKTPDNFLEHIEYPEYLDITEYFDKPKFYNRIISFINPVIRQHINTSFHGFSGEYKDVTCLMVRFDGAFAKELYDGQVEKNYSILNDIYLLMQNKAKRYGGYCVKPDISDKGVVFPVLFGTPVVLENKEQNALRCAVEILQESRLNLNYKSVNIGIGTGMVYSGEFGGILRKDYTVIGNSINFASRLMSFTSKGDPFSILMDMNTNKNTESICITNKIAGITCKGYSGPQIAFLFTKLVKKNKRNSESKLLIGRDKEVKELNLLYKQCLSGQMVFAPIVGDAGIGKSYLVEQFIHDIEESDKRVNIFFGASYQYEKTTSFFCWRSIIKNLIELPENTSVNILLSYTRLFFRSHFPEEEQWITVFLNMLGYDVEESAATKNINNTIKQFHFFSIIDRILQKAAEKKPTIIILEDMHWSDNVSLNMLEYFTSSNGKSEIMIIPVFRDKSLLMSFFKQLGINIIHLEQLTEDASTKLTDKLLNLKIEEPLIINKIVSTSGGNPFFIENIIKTLFETKTLMKDISGKTILSKSIKDIENIIIPSSIQNTILARLNSLHHEEQIVCKTASAIGCVFLKACLIEVTPEGISKDTVNKSLEELIANNIIIRTEENYQEYAFKHMIIHDVIYDTILDTTKKELNSHILQYLEQHYANNYMQIIERLEFHAVESKKYDKVFLYAKEAAKKAQNQFSMQDTITHCQIAIDAWKKINVGKKQNDYFELQICLAEALRSSGQFEKANEIFLSVADECEIKIIQADALRGLGQSFQEQGKFEDAVFALEKALKILNKKAPLTLFEVDVSILKEAIIQFFNYGVLQSKIIQYRGKKLEIAKTRTAILCILNRLYYFGLLEQIAWSALVNFNNVLHFKNDIESFCIVSGDYAVALSSAGLSKISKKIFDHGNEIIEHTNNTRAQNIFNARYAYDFLINNNPKESIKLLKKSTNYFRVIGEQWELMTASGALGQNYFLIGDFDKSIEAYLETERIARELHSVMYIGWSYNKVPFMRYLRKEISYQEAELKILEGIKLSKSVHDHMTLCIHYGHLVYMTIKEKDYQKALSYIEETMNENMLYKIQIPHIKSSLGNVVEAICKIFRVKEIPEEKKNFYWSIAKKALCKLKETCGKYKMLEGPYYRACAAYYLTKSNDKKRAMEYIKKSVFVLKNSPYSWEYQNTLEVGRELSLL